MAPDVPDRGLLGNPTTRPKKRQLREAERARTVSKKDNTTPWGRVTIPDPRSGKFASTELRFQSTTLRGPNDLVGPVIKLLLAIEALYQCLPVTSEIWRIASMDHSGLVSYRALFEEGDPQVVRALCVLRG